MKNHNFPALVFMLIAWAVVATLSGIIILVVSIHMPPKPVTIPDYSPIFADLEETESAVVDYLKTKTKTKSIADLIKSEASKR